VLPFGIRELDGLCPVGSSRLDDDVARFGTDVVGEVRPDSE